VFALAAAETEAATLVDLGSNTCVGVLWLQREGQELERELK
jgi:hypothetical protein